MSTSESEVDRAWTKFYVEYGNAMLAWQVVERELAILFSRLTKIPPDMAIRIFYAPRSFNGRIDIFKSALVTCKVSGDIKSLARQLIAKAKHYSDCRNAFAHDQPLLFQQTAFPGEHAPAEIRLVDGKGQFQSDEEKKRYVDMAITVADITEIAVNFRHLGKLIGDFWSQSASLDKLRERLAALPSLPPLKDQSQPYAEPKRRRKSAQA
jgi:hypothetical protein